MTQFYITIVQTAQEIVLISYNTKYEGWNFNSGNYLFTTDTK